MASSLIPQYALQRWMFNPCTTAERISLGLTLAPINKYLLVYDTDEETFYAWDGVSSWVLVDYLSGGGAITSINALTDPSQTIVAGTSGTDFLVSSIGGTHTFNLPTASAANRGALSSADWSAFNNKIPLAGTIDAAPLTGVIRTTNNVGMWKNAAGFTTETFRTGLINTGLPNTPRDEGTNYLLQAVHKGEMSFGTYESNLDVQLVRSILEATTTDADGGSTYTSKIYAEAFVPLGNSDFKSKIIVDAAQGLVGAANYTPYLTANSFVQKSYVDGVSSPVQIRNTTSLFSTALSAGAGSTAASSIFLGETAGEGANGSPFSVYLGYQAGYQAAGNNGASICLGSQTGWYANGIERSIFIGNRAGLQQTGINNIIIGSNIALPANTTNAINIGNVLYGVNTYSTFTGNPSIVPTTTGRIGIGVVTPNASARLDVSSTSHGILIPRMTLTQRNAIASPAAGLQVIVTGETGGEFLSFYNSSTAAWQRVGAVAGSTGQIQLNNAGALSATSNLFFNTGNQYLGIGTSTPLEAIHVIKDSTRGSFFRMDSYNGAPGLQTYRVNGTVGSPTATESGNFIGLWGMRGYGTSLTNYSSAYIGGRATQTWTTTANGTDLVFATTQNGSNSASIRLTIGNDGLAAFANNATIAGTLGVTSGTSLSTLTTSGATTIGGLTPNASAILDVQSTTKTFLPPRMTGAQSLAIVSPAEGSLIYNTTSKALNVYNGTRFNRVVYSALTSVTSTYQILISDNTVLATSGTFTITMPNAVDSPGKILYIKNTGAGTITLASLLSQTFDGTTTLTSGVRVQYVSDGANWVQIN